MNRVAVRKILRGSSLAVLGAVSPAYAQGEASAGELENIIVTARRVEERVQDVRISITVFNQQQLTKQNVVNSADLAAFTPSLSANSNFGNENSSFAIRGFVQDLGTLPSVDTRKVRWKSLPANWVRSASTRCHWFSGPLAGRMCRV